MNILILSMHEILAKSIIAGAAAGILALISYMIKSSDKINPRIISESENPDIHQIQKLIKKAKSLFGNNKELLDYLNTKFKGRVYTLQFMQDYKALVGVSLVDDLMKVGNNYETVKELLHPFIYLQIVEDEYPHVYIDKEILRGNIKC